MFPSGPPATEAPAAIRVLIVEDERIVALDLKLNLQSLGHVVTGIAASEAQAIEQVVRLRPDVVLMDINLGPGGDGTRAARTLWQEFQVPVIFLTAYAEPETLHRAGLSAPYGYLLKPFQLRELNATIRMAMARREQELLTERAERRLRLAMDAARLGVIEIPRGAAVMSLDGQAGPLLQPDPVGFGLGRDEFLSRFEDAELRGKLQAVLDQGGSVHARAPWRQPDGEQVWLEIHACQFPGEGGLVGVLRDVTSQRRHEELLQQAAVVFDSAAEAIVILDAEGLVRAVNPAFSQLTGWSLAEIAGQAPQELLLAHRADDGPPGLVVGADGRAHGELSCRRRDGPPFPVWAHQAPVLDAEGLLSHQVLTFSDITRLREAEKRIQHQAFHDALTGLGNRRLLDQALRSMIERHAGEAHAGHSALLFIDLDGFKTINDSLGHAVGDELLRRTADAIKAVMRPGDVVVRQGGDEFIVLLPQVGNPVGPLRVADKLLEVLRAPQTLGGEQPVSLTGSIGIAMFPDHADNADDLIKAADSAMYAAKAAGRNRQMLYSPAMAVGALERLQIEQGLRRAMGTPQLQLHWQPVVDLRAGMVLGAEALLRWDHPELGAVSPERFIPVAEDSGLIECLGEWVLREACRLGSRWLAEGASFSRLAVNVSARQLQQPGFPDLVRAVLDESGYPPAALELEITEGSLQRGEDSIRALRALRALGVKLALDDFGTGFSSLSMLKLLPLDRLKIDRSFVRDLQSDPGDHAITTAIAAMASALGLSITAEGVEFEAQRQALDRLGVDDAQGFLYRPALPPEQVQALFGRRPD